MRAPTGYVAPSRAERRCTDVIHNRRLGWMLALAHAGGPLPVSGTGLEAKVAIVLERLPDLFPDAATAADYVHDEADREIAAAILASSDE